MADKDIAILAGGCFWGMEDLFRKLPGVIETHVGYTGGDLDSPQYKQVKTGATGHAEAIRIVYDPAKTSYRALLEFFFQIHDPTTPLRQGNDRGPSYRSAIYFTDADQQAVARTKQKIHARLFEIRLFNDDPRTILHAQFEILRHSIAYMKLSLWPMVWLAAPLLLLTTQLQSHYGYQSPQPGQTFVGRIDWRDRDGVQLRTSMQSEPLTVVIGSMASAVPVWSEVK